MTPQEWIDLNRGQVEQGAADSGVWGIVANGCFAKAEHEALVALFESQGSAIMYLKTSRLPDDQKNRWEDGYNRSFRRDSYLYEFNDQSQHDFSSAMVVQLQKLVPPYIARHIANVVIDPDPLVGAEPADPDPRCRHYIGVTLSDKAW
jgi:hypothetical protein